MSWLRQGQSWPPRSGAGAACGDHGRVRCRQEQAADRNRSAGRYRRDGCAVGTGGAADSSIDVVISNCVINLSTDKSAVIGEMFRVLTPGGRLEISDVVAEDDLSPADRAERGSYVGCSQGKHRTRRG